MMTGSCMLRQPYDDELSCTRLREGAFGFCHSDKWIEALDESRCVEACTEQK